MKKFLSMMAFVAVLVSSCGEDNKDNPGSEEAVTYSYVGSTVTEYSGQSCTTENVVLEVTASESGTAIDILFNQVKFVDRMPALDIIVPGVACAENGDKGYSFAGENIVPLMGKEGLVEYPKYTVKSVSGNYDEAQISVSVTFGDYPVTYAGTRVSK